MAFREYGDRHDGMSCLTSLHRTPHHLGIGIGNYIKTLKKFVKFRREFLQLMNKIFPNMLRMISYLKFVCCGIPFPHNLQKKTKSLYMVLFVKVREQKIMKLQLCGFLIVDLCIRLAELMHLTYHLRHMRI